MKTLIFLSLILFSTQVWSQIVEEIELTPGSSIIDEDDQRLINDWLPEEFRYKAELIYLAKPESGFLASDFHNSCDGSSNTLIVGRTLQGNIFGGYNSGVWSSNGSTQMNLDENFLFSVDLQEIYRAESDVEHITNAPNAGPFFGSTSSPDLRFFSDNGFLVGVVNLLGEAYHCPKNSDAECYCRMNEGICDNIPNVTGRISCTSYEVWQLKDCGTKSFSVGIDYDEDGVFDTFSNCYDQTPPMFPGSKIVDSSKDALLASWVPEEFLYESDLLFESTESVISLQTFLNNVAGFYDTVILIETELGEVIGGYNEGFWTGASNVETGLLGNFIFNLSDKRLHQALPGGDHTITGSVIRFGEEDLYINLGSDEHFTKLSDYSETSTSPENSNSYLYLCENSFFEIERIEVWKLKESGTSIFLPSDADGNGICDHLDPNKFFTSGSACPGDFDGDNFISVTDLTGFLSVFGGSCN